MAVAFGGSKFGAGGSENNQAKLKKPKANKGTSVKSAGNSSNNSAPTLDQATLQSLTGQNFNQGPPAPPAKKAAAVAAPKTFADYMAAAQSILGGQTTSTPDLSSYATQQKAVESQSASADAKLAAMYQQLKGSFDAAAPGIANQYAGTKKDLASNSDQAVSATKTADKAASAELTAQLQKLGIGDAMKPIVNQGTTIQGDTAAALANIQANKSATLNNNDTKAAAALDYNRGVGQAAVLGGTEARATNEQNTQSQIAAILAAKQAAAANVTTSGPSTSDYETLAKSLQDSDEANDPNTLANQFKAQELAATINKNNASAKTQKSASTTSILKTLLGNVSSNGTVDTDQLKSVLQQLKKSGLL